MINSLLSHDLPRSRLVSAALCLLLLAMLLAPLTIGGLTIMNMFAKIAIFAVLVGSFDLLLGYTGMISFAHTMYYGIGAYGVGIMLKTLGVGWDAIFVGFVGGALLSLGIAVGVGLFSMRTKTIFFAMITLAVANAFAVLVNQFYTVTGGHDGLIFQIPHILKPAFVIVPRDVLGVPINGTTLSYYLILVICGLLFLLMLRLVNSPFGRVLQAIRENELRAEALGYNVLRHRVIVSCIAAVLACTAGALNALWLRFVGPEVTLDIQVMLDVLLIVVIGGMGTLYGAAIGAGIFVFAETYLQSAIAFLAEMFHDIPVLSVVIHPDRWVFWLGVLFVISVYYFPEGIVGHLRSRVEERAKRSSA